MYPLIAAKNRVMKEASRPALAKLSTSLQRHVTEGAEAQTDEIVAGHISTKSMTRSVIIIAECH